MTANKVTISILWLLTMQDDDDEYVNGYDEATHTLFWDDYRSQNGGASRLRLISKHATALRHIHIRCGLCWAQVSGAKYAYFRKRF